VKRATNTEHARRINFAVELLKSTSVPNAVQELICHYAMSQSQAYRYVQIAQKEQTFVPIPQEKKTFTVKLPLSLLKKIHHLARKKQRSLSEIVVMALEQFFTRE
jgi:macrodomain Ter protein organizer (MatP/YcbG family)